jgi:hypothetical protein
MRCSLVALALVPLVLTACPKPGPPPTSVSQQDISATPTSPATTPADATCMLGMFRVQTQQRMSQDDGVTALLEDQRLGDTAILFTSQRDAIANHNSPEPGSRPHAPTPPQDLIVARGAMVTQELDDLVYVDNNGAKPVATATERAKYTYFLADAAWDCSSVREAVLALQLPPGPSAAACDSVRSGCQPVHLDA